MTLHQKNVLLVVFFMVFLCTRLYSLSSIVIFGDDLLTVGSLGTMPWEKIPSWSYTWVTEFVTGPYLPTVLQRIVINLFGPDVWYMRMVSVIVSCVSFLLFIQICGYVCKNTMVKWLTVSVFMLSMPIVVYSQQIQPSIFYCFTSVLQIFIYIRLRHKYIINGTLLSYAKFVTIFTIVSLFCYSTNYMSIMVTIALSGLFVLDVASTQPIRRVKNISVAALLIAASLLIMGLLVMGRAGSPDAWKRYPDVFYVNNIQDLFLQLYDMVTYLLNFTFSYELNHQHGHNLLSAPFAVFVIIGVIAFCKRGATKTILFLCSLFGVFLASHIGLFPLGGLRHNLVLSPFIFLLFGFGLDHEVTILKNTHRGLASKLLPFCFFVFVFVLFAFSGTQYYTARSSLITPERVVSLADKHQVTHVAAYNETFEMLTIQAYTSGFDFSEHGIVLHDLPSNPAGNEFKTVEEPFIVVSNRYYVTDETAWDAFYTPKMKIPYADRKTITPLVEDQGAFPLEQIGIVSLYYPVNGFFAYLVSPKD